MLTLSNVIGPILASFATLFTNPTGQKAQILLVGATLATGRRAVAAVVPSDGTARIVELVSQIAAWYRSGKSAFPIRWARVRTPKAPAVPGPPLHTPVGGPDPDPGVVCPALAIGGHLPGSTDRSGPGDQEPVIQPGHSSYRAHSAGSLLWDHPGHAHIAKTSSDYPTYRRLVRQTVAGLRGCHRPGAALPVADVRGFFTVRSQR